MKILVTVSVVFAAAVVAQCKNVLPVKEIFGLSPKIIAGEPALPGQFPWQVYIRYIKIGYSFCGGALVHPRWVLTAAHCASGSRSFTVTLGALYSDGTDASTTTVIQTDTAIVHAEYDSYNIVNDIALIDLKQEVDLKNNIQTIPLGNEHILDGVKLTVSGWGKTSDWSSSVSDILNYVELITISKKQCEDVYIDVDDGILCCVGKGPTNACNGDSGGPLVQFDKNGVATHVGVVSFVHVSGCATGKPSGYTRTQYYKKWIQDIVVAKH